MFDTTPAAEPDAAPKPRRDRRPLIIGGALLVVLAAAGIAYGVSASSGPGTMHLTGSLNVGLLGAVDTAPGADLTNPTAGDPCSTAGGYTDITAGATVTIGGGSGQPIGVGALSAGKENAAGYCSFAFDVTVPAGQSAYTVTISHRGTQTFTPAQAAKPILLTLGN